jgi:hypothetical protein
VGGLRGTRPAVCGIVRMAAMRLATRGGRREAGPHLPTSPRVARAAPSGRGDYAAAAAALAAGAEQARTRLRRACPGRPAIATIPTAGRPPARAA